VTFFACSHPTQPIDTPLDSSVNGKSLNYSAGQAFSLDLDVSADAGYQWDYTISEPAVVVVVSGSTIRPKNPGPVVPGGATMQTFYFRAAGRGQCTITLVERQGWMKDVPPIVTVEFTVVVR
jgi:predicted secreted protein